MEIVNIMVCIYLILVIKRVLFPNTGHTDDDFVVTDARMMFSYPKFLNVNKRFPVDVKVRRSNLQIDENIKESLNWNDIWAFVLFTTTE